MTPRERAEALGWVPYGKWWRRSKKARTAIVWDTSDGRGWAVNLAGHLVHDYGTTRYFPTEDEALAHALLLRDVVLS